VGPRHTDAAAGGRGERAGDAVHARTAKRWCCAGTTTTRRRTPCGRWTRPLSRRWRGSTARTGRGGTSGSTACRRTGRVAVALLGKTGGPREVWFRDPRTLADRGTFKGDGVPDGYGQGSTWFLARTASCARSWASRARSCCGTWPLGRSRGSWRSTARGATPRRSAGRDVRGGPVDAEAPARGAGAQPGPGGLPPAAGDGVRRVRQSPAADAGVAARERMGPGVQPGRQDAGVGLVRRRPPVRLSR
jgi:hypothetical protein